MKREHILMLDCETAGTIEAPLVFDLGCAVVDRKGRVYETLNMICYEVFYEFKTEMANCFYQSKLPQYKEEIWNGEREVFSYEQMRRKIRNLIKKYDIKAVCAHNAKFDVNALNNTLNVLNGTKKAHFLPKSVEIWDTLKMSQQVLLKMPTYHLFCKENKYMTNHYVPHPRLTAEIIYRFITLNKEFEEAHTGLCDVLIETEILAYLFKKHKKMDKVLYHALKRA